MKLKQLVAIVLSVLIVTLLTSAAMGVVTWKSFWLLVIPIAAFAYWVFPHMD